MGSETPLSVKIPVIDFSMESLKPGNPQWDSVRAQVRQALQEFSCFEAVFDKIPAQVREVVFTSLQQLFDLPFETKSRNVSKNPFHGYAQFPALPLYESLGIEDADDDLKVVSFANALWPRGKPNFCETISSYMEQLVKLDQMIRRMILESLGVEKYLEEHMGSTSYLLRFNKYKVPETTETKVGLNPHTDKTIITILSQNQIEGLEVQTKDGEWISVNPSPGSFTVMIGDSLHAWSNGRLSSLKHRVTMTGNEERYVVGLFTEPKEGYLVKVPEELVDEEHPLLFKPFDYMKFLGFYHTEAGQRAESALKAFCGV